MRFFFGVYLTRKSVHKTINDLLSISHGFDIPQYVEQKSNEHQKDMGNTITALK